MLRHRQPCSISTYPSSVICSEGNAHCVIPPYTVTVRKTVVPYQCYYADCSFLHANSCSEHKLISACCCTGR
nr:unnamed protein product [Callosobruchus analis]